MLGFSSHEIRDIIISMLVIAIAFAIVFSARNIGLAISLIPVSLVAVGLAFVLHELAHKFVAIRYGYRAEYKMWIQGLFLALITSFFGFIFAAPGAVYIHGYNIKKEENGKISLAGPLTNIILAILFILFLTNVTYSQSYLRIVLLGVSVNSFLAIFNLLPIAIFDGAKVFRWNPIVWALTFALAFGLVYISLNIPVFF
jgi:Zn-dependent protease